MVSCSSTAGAESDDALQYSGGGGSSEIVTDESPALPCASVATTLTLYSTHGARANGQIVRVLADALPTASAISEPLSSQVSWATVGPREAYSMLAR